MVLSALLPIGPSPRVCRWVLKFKAVVSCTASSTGRPRARSITAWRCAPPSSPTASASACRAPVQSPPGEIAECAARTQGAALLCGATVNLRVGPEAREKRRQAARSPKAGATLGTILLIHWTHFRSRPPRRAAEHSSRQCGACVETVRVEQPHRPKMPVRHTPHRSPAGPFRAPALLRWSPAIAGERWPGVSPRMAWHTGFGAEFRGSLA